MNNQPTVSVVMATFNGERYIREQLDSIIGQTYPIYELIIQDDCSKDSTVSICREYEQKYSFIHVYVNESNLGFVRNFEKALKRSTGDYVALSDQDDIWVSDHVRILLDSIGDCGMACGNSEFIDGEGKSLGLTLADCTVVDNTPGNLLKRATSILYYGNSYQGASMLLRREFLQMMLPFPKGITFHDEWAVLLACFTMGFRYADSILLYYRIHGNNATDPTKQKSRLGEWYNLGRHGLRVNRLPYLNGIVERRQNLTVEQRQLIDDSVKHFTKARGILRPLQKIRIWIYITIHYKTIFYAK